MFEVIKKYVSNRQKLHMNTKIFYFKKLFLPLIPTCILLFFGIKFCIKHENLATSLVSVTAIIIAFLVFLMSTLLTKDSNKNIPNTNIKYSEILANNTAFLTIISSVSLFINLIYVYVSNLECKSIMALNFISFFALYFIFLTIKIVVDDILFLSNIFKN